MRGLQGPCASAVSSDVGADRLVALPALSRCGRTCRLRLAPKICGSPSLYGNCLWRVPWFHENALLQVDGRDDDLTDDGAGLRCWREFEDSAWRARDTCIGGTAVLSAEMVEGCGIVPDEKSRPVRWTAEVCKPEAVVDAR